LLSTTPLAARQQRIYAEHGFGEKGGDGSIASDLNPAGLVAGIITEEEGRRRAVVTSTAASASWAPGGMKVSPRPSMPMAWWSVPRRRTASGARHAFRYEEAAGMRDLGTLGGTSSYATAITRDGMIAGYADTSGGDFHAFVTKADHSLQDRHPGGASSYASGLNTHGVVVGTAQRSDGFRRAFVYRPGEGMQEIGTCPADASARPPPSMTRA
jgi:probable HAF family extracellular repeat protein